MRCRPELWLLLLACGGAPAGTSTGQALSERRCPPQSIVTYENFGAPFFRSWCSGCHSSDLPSSDRQAAPLGIDFDTRAKIREHLDAIYSRAGDSNTTMPPRGGPDAEERQRLGDWLACGTP